MYSRITERLDNAALPERALEILQALVVGEVDAPADRLNPASADNIDRAVLRNFKAGIVRVNRIHLVYAHFAFVNCNRRQLCQQPAGVLHQLTDARAGRRTYLKERIPALFHFRLKILKNLLVLDYIGFIRRNYLWAVFQIRSVFFEFAVDNVKILDRIAPLD